MRKVERTVSLTLAAKAHDIDTVADGVVGVADRLGGYVASSSVSSQHGGEFVLKVPAAQLQAALAQLSRLAHVRARTQDAQDITGSYDSARARLADARTERKILLRQLAKATTPNETESIRARLRRARRRREIS